MSALVGNWHVATLSLIVALLNQHNIFIRGVVQLDPDFTYFLALQEYGGRFNNINISNEINASI